MPKFDGVGRPHDKGEFSADIPADAIAEAVRALERLKGEKNKKADEIVDDGGVEVSLEVDASLADASAAGSAEGDGQIHSTEVAHLKMLLDLSQTKAREAFEKLKEEHELKLRLASDLENTKKRMQREMEELRRYGTEKLVKEILPVLDNLDRALAHASASPDASLRSGVEIVRRQFEDVLKAQGAESYSAVGQMFDPAWHQGMQQVEGTSSPAGTVVLEYARGFKLHGRLLRPAMVGVATVKGPPAPSPAHTGSETDDPV